MAGLVHNTHSIVSGGGGGGGVPQAGGPHSGTVVTQRPTPVLLPPPAARVLSSSSSETATAVVTAASVNTTTTDCPMTVDSSSDANHHGVEKQQHHNRVKPAATNDDTTSKQDRHDDGDKVDNGHANDDGNGDHDDERPDEIDIVINNVVCSFSVGCHLNLRQIALNGANVEFRRESGMVSMKLRNPYTTASIWSSGKITCTGATSEDMSKKAARRYARLLQKLGFRARFKNFKVVNVLGTCTMPFAIRLVPFSQANKPIAQYEPELHPGVTYKIKEIRATLKIFSTGSITVTAPSVSAVQQSIERIFPLVYEHRKERTCPEDMPRSQNHLFQQSKGKGASGGGAEARVISRSVTTGYATCNGTTPMDEDGSDAEEDVDDVEAIGGGRGGFEDDDEEGFGSEQSWG